MSADPAWEALQDTVRDAIAEAVAGTEWQPPEGAILTECVAVMGWYKPDGTYGSSHVRCGSPWGTRGLIVNAAERIEAHDRDWEYEDDE